MKKGFLTGLLIACLLLTGCAPLLERSYTTSEPHSSKYWESEAADTLRAENGVMTCEGADEAVLSEGHGDLKGAYLAACAAHFPFTGTLPDQRFFTQPQYNTWIELGTDQTTDNILRYARGILEHGLPAGILMIDGGWQEDYGVWRFHPGRFPDPAGMVKDTSESTSGPVS